MSGSDGYDRGFSRCSWRVAVGALAVGVFVDLVTTAAGFHVGLVESNPAGVVVLSTLGVYGLPAAKVAAAVALVGQFGICRRRFGRTEQAVAFGGCLLVAGVWFLAAIWNTALIVATVGGLA